MTNILMKPTHPLTPSLVWEGEIVGKGAPPPSINLPPLEENLREVEENLREVRRGEAPSKKYFPFSFKEKGNEGMRSTEKEA